jgi:Fe2+ or Zn2+ uptake regulation protein
MPDTPTAARLRDAGLRVTAPRVAVLDALPDRAHLDADAIRRAAAQRLGSISVQAVYDILAALTAAGLVRRIEPAGSAALYEARVADNHHHVVCRLCGAIADIDCAVGVTPCLEPSAAHGYLVDEAEVTFWGTCPRCANPDRQVHDRTNEGAA